MKSLADAVEDGRLKVRRAHYMYKMKRLSKTMGDMTEAWTKSQIYATGALGRLAAALRRASKARAAEDG